MSKASEIPTALLDHYETLAVGSPPLPLAQPDITFDPATDSLNGKYIEAGYFRNTPKWEGLAADVIDQGVFVVSVVGPKNLGVIWINDAAQEVADHFPKDLVLTSGATRVKLDKQPVIGSPLLEGDKTIVAVTISWVS